MFLKGSECPPSELANSDTRPRPTTAAQPSPAAVEDCYDAYRWLVDQAGGAADPRMVVVVGSCSEGGMLAVALLLKIKEAGGQMPAAATPLSPWIDRTQSSPTFYSNHGKCKYATKG